MILTGNGTGRRPSILALVVAVCVTLAIPTGMARAAGENDNAPSITIDMPVSTQGLFWPPAAYADKDGNFVTVGLLLTEVAPAVVVPIPGAAIVSKNTVPPLDAQGREDFSNPLQKPYTIIRHLDLSPGSEDRKIELYTSSFGPIRGNFGGGARIPRLGESAYNLNSITNWCNEQFPTDSQLTYTRKSYPLNQVPIWGFRGDGVAYDVDTGEEFVPSSPFGPGEVHVDERPIRKPITLDDWLNAKGTVKITLTSFNEQVNAYTSARFDFKFSKLLPNQVYHVPAIRTKILDPRPIPTGPDAFGIPGLVITDSKGNASYSVEEMNPFPDPAVDDRGLRIVATGLAYHADNQGWGSCSSILNSGVDSQAIFNTLSDGTFDMTNFVTKAAPAP